MDTLLTLLKKPKGIGTCFAFFILLFYTELAAQNSISGTINSYAAVTSFDPCANRLTVNSTAGFRPGSVVLLIQMQGATINDSNTPNFGNITNYGSAGAYEKATIAQIQGNNITFTRDLINSYDPAGKVQLVTIPQFGNVIVDGPLTASPWDGTVGGVLAFEASGTVTLNANINVDGLGFRGGAVTENKSNGCNPLFQNFVTQSTAYYYNRTSWEGSFKGEGIAQVIAGKELGKGPQANGGGGGNDHNSGGGGGANAASGGVGGRNLEIPYNLFRRDNQCRSDHPGEGGRPLDVDRRIFMGGGGGGGHSNNVSSNNINRGTPGGNGGGIIYIAADQLNGQGRVVSANGNNAQNGSGDGVGGGGAGGTIILNVRQLNTLTLAVQARGGKGADVDNLGDDRCFGPGGGGSGGLVVLSSTIDPTELTPNVAGGIAGIGYNSTSAVGCNGLPNGAQTGGPGTVSRNVLIPEGILEAGSGCITPTPIDLLYFRAKAGTNSVHLEWATAREINNNYFSIERSEDGTDFYEIGQVPGKGNFVGVSTYTSQDNTPLYGIAYYRIKQVDDDGKFTYTHIVAVEYITEEAVVSIFPNPIEQEQPLNVKIYTPEEGEANLRIYTVLGNEIYNRQYSLSKGTQTLTLNLNGYAAGMYIVQIQIGGFYKTQKIKVAR